MSEKSAIEYSMIDLIDEIKSKTLVSVSDIEKYNQLGGKVILKIEELTNSRDNWRRRAEKAEGKLKELTCKN